MSANGLPDRVHRRQFVLGPRPVPVAGWVSRRVSDALVLSHCPDLPVASAVARDGSAQLLVGTAVETDASRPSPSEQLAARSGDEVRSLAASWSGRWVLIEPRRLSCDASGLLSCFFAALRGELWASSSPALLASIMGCDPAASAGGLERAQRIDWFPLPQSGIPGVRRLLPSQTLPLDGDAEPEPRRLPAAAGARSYAERLESLEARLVVAMRNVAGEHDTLYLPVTGGFDSRLLLAAAVKSGVEVSTYTYVKPDPSMAYADRALPPVLAAAAGVPHRFIARGPLSHDRLEAFDAHTAGHCVEVDRDYLAYGQWDQLGRPGVVLRGGVFEVGRCYYWRKLRAQGDRAAAVAAAFQPDPQQAAAIAEWVRWCERHPEPSLDWRDRFYLEQRLAGWLGSLEQALDLTAHERIHVANCHDFISTLLELPVEVRLASRHHVDLIRRMAPALLDVPFDARMPVRERAGRELKALGAATDKRAHVRFRLRRLGRRLVRFATAG